MVAAGGLITFRAGYELVLQSWRSSSRVERTYELVGRTGGGK